MVRGAIGGESGALPRWCGGRLERGVRAALLWLLVRGAFGSYS